MKTRKLKVTALKEIKEGTTQGKDGKTFTWKLQEVTATNEDGSAITETLKTFAELPLNELIEVEVEKQEHETYGTSYMLKKPNKNVSREELLEVVKRIDDLEEAVKKLEPSKEVSKVTGEEKTDLDDIPFWWFPHSPITPSTKPY